MTTQTTLLWLQAGSCGGCSMAALEAEGIGLPAALARFGIRLLWHPSLSEESGEEARAILEKVLDGTERLDILCVEGAILRGPGGSGRFQMLAGTGRSVAWWASELAGRARHTVAVGTCAAYGGMPAAAPNPADACGLQYLDDDGASGLLAAGWRGPGGLPVVNIAGCAPHPGWMTETLAALAGGMLTADDLDTLGRPRFWADHLAHHGCGRNEFYEFKASAESPADMGCLMENLGCKATQAPGDCNLRRWNGDGSCTDGGYACIACTVPGFQDTTAAFQTTPKVAGIPVGLPLDMPKAWFVALAALSKSATPARVRRNAHSDHIVVPPQSPRDARKGKA